MHRHSTADSRHSQFVTRHSSLVTGLWPLVTRHSSLCIAAAALVAANALATSYTWCGAGEDGCWTNSANWLVNGTTPVAAGYPGVSSSGAASPSDAAVFPANATAEVTLAEELTIGTLNLSAANVELTLVGGAQGTNAPLRVTSTFNFSGGDGTLVLDNFCISAPTLTSSQGHNVVLRNAAALVLAHYTTSRSTSLSLSGGSSMLVLGNLNPTANYPLDLGLSGGSSLRVMGSSTLPAGCAFALSGGSSLYISGNFFTTGSSLSLAGDSSASVYELRLVNPGQTILIDDSTLEMRVNCLLGNTAPGGGTLTFRGTHPVLRVLGNTFRYNNNNASMNQPFVFNYVVPEGGFEAPPLQHLANTTTTSFSGQNSVKAVAKFTVDASSPALAAGTTTTTPLFFSQPGICHISKAFADISDATAALAFAAADGASAPADDASSKFVVATCGSGPDAEPPAVAVSAISPALPVAVAHKTLTAAAAVTALSTTADATVLRLYAGRAADGSDAEVVAVEEVASVGIHNISWTAPAGAFEQTYYLFAEVADLDGEGLAVSSSASATTSAKTVDSATYTWAGGASGDWSDPANWSDDQEGNCLGYPNSTDATALFPASTKANVVLDGVFTIKTLNVNRQDLNVVFSSGGATTNESKLAASSFVASGTYSYGGTIVFDGVAFVAPGTSLGVCRTILLRNGANFHASSGDTSLGNHSRFMVTDGSCLSAYNLLLQDGANSDALFIVDNATIVARNAIYAPYSNKGSAGIRLQGARPLLILGSNGGHFRANNAVGGSFVEFLIPAGGYASCPIRGTGAMTVRLGNNGSSAGSAPIAFRVLPESPAFFADATLTQPLISWATAGINTAMVTTSCASEAAAFSWGEGTYPTTLSVTIAGVAHADRLVVTGAPSEVPANGVVYGAIDGLSENDARTFTAPSGTFDLSATRRATCTGWRLYAVDPATGARTLEQASTALTCNYVHDGSLHELEWQWREEFLVTPTAGAGGSVSAPAWAENGKTATITATPDAGYVFREWTGVPADGLEFAASRPFTATNAAAPAATFDAAIYASPDATGSGDGTRANPYTLAAAVSAAAGRTGVAVVLLAGDYPLSATLTVSSAVRITSESGDPADVTIKPATDDKGAPLALAPLVKLTAAGARLSSVTVSGGTPASSNPGNVWVENATLFNCVLTGITGGGSTAAGGAAYLKNGRITRSRISDNTFGSATHGAGVFMDGASPRVEYCLITNNIACNYTGRGGGGIYAKAGTISHCDIIGNKTRYFFSHGCGGGGVYADGSVHIEWCLVARNSCGSAGGGGLYLSGAAAGTVVDHCTVVGNNDSEYNYGGVDLATSNYSLRNCIVWGNTVTIPSDRARNQLNADSSYFINCYGNCFPVAYGNDTLVADPLFVDADAGDYRLMPGSPCIAPGYGCIPFDAETLQVGFPHFTDDTFPANEPLSFMATATGGAGGYSFRWRVDDLLAGTQGAWGAPSASGAFGPTLAPGHYRLTVEVTDAFGATASMAHTLYAGVAGTVYVVPAGTPGNAPEPPYDTLATAANDPRDAIHYCLPGSTLLVAPGDYALTSELIIPRAVRVAAAEGPGTTSLYRDGPLGAGTPSRVVHIADAGAVLSGFAVTNGYFVEKNAGMGTGILNEGGMVTNCVVAWCNAWLAQYAPAALANLNGVVADCRIHNNVGAGAYGGGFFQRGSRSYAHDVEIYDHVYTGYNSGSYLGGKIIGGVAERFYVHDNSLGYGSGGSSGGGLGLGDAELRNSLLVRNKCGEGGGGGLRVSASGARIVNCTIADNESGRSVTSGKGGGLYCEADSIAFTMINTVFSGNRVTVPEPPAGDPDWSGVAPAKCDARNCVFSSAASALGVNAIVSDNVRFADAENGDYTPGTGSCLRDNGAPWRWTAADVDLARNPRVAGAAVDIGALEAGVDESISCNVEVTGHDDAGDPVLVAIEPVGANLDGFEARVTVYGADGEVAATSGWGGSLLRTFDLEPGSYTVFVEVRNGSGAEGEANDGRIPLLVVPEVVYVVPEAARLGDPVPPYTSWETAATNLVDAALVAGNGTRVVLTNGSHVIAAPVVFGKASEIVSVEGPERTEIVRAGAYGQGDRFSMVTLGDAGASLSGLTIRNGFGLASAFGALVQNLGGTVSNCVFTEAVTSSSYGGVVYNGNGLVTHCVFTNVTGVLGDGGIYYQYGNEARGEWLDIGGNALQNNYYSYGACKVTGGVLRNCSITNNVMARPGNGGFAGGVYLMRGRLENCLIANNVARTGAGGVRVEGANCEIVNCTVVSNACIGTDAGGYWAGGIAVLSGASVSLLNTIVWGNRDNSAMAAGHDFGDIAIFGSGAYTATTSIVGDRDPKFRRFGPAAAAYDFRLKSKSPAVGAGTPWAGCADALDLDGRPRVFGKAIDLGCFECERLPGTVLGVR